MVCLWLLCFNICFGELWLVILLGGLFGLLIVLLGFMFLLLNLFCVSIDLNCYLFGGVVCPACLGSIAWLCLC